MPDDQLRSAIQEIRVRLQDTLDSQLASFEEQQARAVAAARQAAEAEADERWTARLESLRAELTARLENELAAARIEGERRLDTELQRVRAEAEQSMADATARFRQELEAALEAERSRAEQNLVTERQGLMSELETARQASAALQAEQVRVSEALETERARAKEALEAERARAAETLDAERQRAKQEIEAEREKAREHLEALETERARAKEALEAERARAAETLDAERQRAKQEIEAEREKAREHREALEAERARATETLEAERQRATQEIEAERRKAREEREARELAEVALAREREQNARLAEETTTRAAAAATEALASERQTQLAVVERLLGAVRTIGAARSLTDVLGALVAGAAAEAPRVATFIVKGPALQPWKATGFGGDAAGREIPLETAGVLAEAVRRAEAVSTADAPPPAFAEVPGGRVGLAVPVTVGGQAVAVLYADDASVDDPVVPAAWPEAIQILGTHASACLSHLTAVRTAQAMRLTTAGAPARPAAATEPAGSGEDEGGARRYARLLVSEIKLYNESAVRLGRQNRDLLQRLRPEIERARRLYEERVSASLATRNLYFQQELVQTLADGDPALLGGSA